MSKTSDKSESYVLRATDSARQYAEDLLQDNKRLRNNMVQMEGRLLAAEDKLRALEAELLARREHEQLLRRALDDSERESETFVQRYLEVERHTTNLANLYVASYRLHGSLERDEVLASIREIVSNLIGCEQMAVYELEPENAALVLADSVGIDTTHCQRIELGQGAIGRAAETATTFVADPAQARGENGVPPLSACVPLLLGGRVSGAIALFELLPQKSGLDELDRELFDLLATHCATALYCARLHAQLRQDTPS